MQNLTFGHFGRRRWYFICLLCAQFRW